MSGNDHAIVVGIRRYPTLGGSAPPTAMDLKAPDEDAKAVADWISGLPDGRPKQVKLIRSADYPDPFGPAGPKPIANDIVAAFADLFGQPRRADGRVGQRLYLYVSGHGFGFRRHLGALFTANASDLDRDHVYIPDYFEWVIEAGLFKEYVLWFDACSSRDRLVLPKFASLKPVKSPLSPQGREMVAYAARFFLSAVENDIGGRPCSVFTHTLLEGLRGAAADPATGAVTTESLRDYLFNNMRRHMSQAHLDDPNVSKEPDFGTVDDFVLVPPSAVVTAGPAFTASAPAGPRHRLAVTGLDPATEVFVVDAGNRLVARGLKQADIVLPDGDYTIRAILGRSEWQETIQLDSDRNVILPSITFASAAPLVATDRTHETHMDAIKQASTAVKKGPGEGSSLIVMARWWTNPAATGSSPFPLPEPQAGLALHHHDQRESLDLAAGAVEGDLPGDRWATRALTVDPGLHRLTMGGTDGAPVEMTLTALEGWQTGVFLLYELLPEPERVLRGRRLADVSVLMWKGKFEDASPEFRLAESARIALADERSVMSRELLEAAKAGSGDPMLTLYALHLMLLIRDKEQEDQERPERAAVPARGPARPAQFDHALFDQVLTGAIDLLGEDHPDVRAIRLAAGRQAGRLPVVVPPMLWRSWSALVRASNDNPRLLPVGLWERVAEQALHRPFMTSMRPSAMSMPQESRLRRVEESLGHLTRRAVKVEAAQEASLEQDGMDRPDVAAGMAPLSGLPPVTARSLDPRRLSVEMDVPRSVIDRAMKGW